ncbi:MAG: DM13 domain-containing protein [Maricaulaceae bacterium]
MTKLAHGELSGKRFPVEGAWTVVREDDGLVLEFSETFQTRYGPELEVFLSPKKFDAVTGVNALDDAVRLGRLQALKGAQRYAIPAHVDLNAIRSVVIHCEYFLVLWGGGDLTGSSADVDFAP